MPAIDALAAQLVWHRCELKLIEQSLDHCINWDAPLLRGLHPYRLSIIRLEQQEVARVIRRCSWFSMPSPATASLLATGLPWPLTLSTSSACWRATPAWPAYGAPQPFPMSGRPGGTEVPHARHQSKPCALISTL